jgi:hypothetical protein
MSENHLHGPDVFAQVNDSMKSVIDMTSRIDERVKMIMEKQIDNDKRLILMMDHLNVLSSRVTVLEARDSNKLDSIVQEQTKRLHTLEKDIEILKLHTSTSMEKWKNVITTLLQVGTAVAVGYILVKLGISKP